MGKKKRVVEEEEGFELDFDKILNNLQDSKLTLLIIGILIVIGLTAIVRIQNLDNLQGKFLLGLDPYVFMRYAKNIVEWGKVPSNDTMRYYPQGFDTTRELLMPSYAVAVLYSIISFFNAGVTVSQVSIIYPVIVTCIAMIFFYLFTKDLFGDTIAFLSSILLSVVNGFIFRTSAGFTEKEPIAIMFIFPLLFFLIRALKNKDLKKKIIYSLLAGACLTGAVLSWGGVNFTMISIGAAFIIASLLGITKREDSLVYAIIALSIGATTFFVGRFGNFIEIFFDYRFFYYPVALFLNVYKFELYPKIKKKLVKFKPKKLPEELFIGVSALLILLILSLIYPGIGFHFKILNFAYERLNNPFGTDVFAMSVNENQPPYFYDPNGGVDWWNPMNYTFFTMLFGSFILFYDMFKNFRKRQRLIITTTYILTLVLFIFSRFSTDAKYQSITNFFNRSFFGFQLHHLILFGFFIYMIYFFVKNINKLEKFASIKIEHLFFFFWFFITAVAARGGVRIIFAVLPPAMILSGYFFKKTYDWVKGFVDSNTLAAIVVYSFLAILLWYNFSLSMASNSNFYSSFTSEWDTAMDWVQLNTPVNSVFTHWWDYGYWVQTMGNRTTTLDGGNFDVALNHLTGRYLFAPRVFENETFNMTEPATTLALDFGKPNYFLVIDDDVLKYVQMGRIGKRPTYYTVGYYSEEVENSLGLDNATKYPSLLLFNSYYGAFPLQQTFTDSNGFIFKSGSSNTVIYNIVFPYDPVSGNLSNKPYGAVFNSYYPEQGTIIPFNCYCIYGEKCYYYDNNGIPECPLLTEDGVVLITQNASDNLFTYLYLLNVSVPGFDLVYDNQRPLNIKGMLSQSLTDIKIYEINYTELEPFTLDKKLPNYWTEPGGTYWE